MSYRESDIVHENPKAWVLNDRKGDCYTVFVKGLTHSVSDSAYPRDEDGLSIAKARADFFHKRSLEAAPTKSDDRSAQPIQGLSKRAQAMAGPKVWGRINTQGRK